MATNELKTRIKHAYKTESDWTSSNPILLKGEIAYSSDKNNKYKIGDGTHKWSDLAYAIPVTKSDIGLGNVDNTADSNKSVKYATSAGSAITATTANAVAWGNVTGKPSTYTPASHTHDDRYYTESEIDTKLGNKANSSHTHTKAQITDFPSSLPANGGTSNYTNYLNVNALPSKANLDSYTTPGFYYCNANATVATFTNCPTTNALFMVVGTHAGVYQEVTEYMSSGQKKYMRNYYSGTWGSWYRVYTTADKPTKSDIGLSNVDNTADSAKSVKYATSAGSATTATSATKVNGHTVNSDVPSGAKFTDTVYTHPSYTAKSSGLYKVAVDSTGHVSGATAVTKSDITALGIPASDTNTDTKVTSVGNHYTPSGGTTKSASGGTTTNATGSGNAVQVVTGVTVDAAGHVTGVTSKGVYSTDTNTTYSDVTTSTHGLMTPEDKTKLDGIAKNANNYSLPTASSSTLGGVKTTSAVTSTTGLTACPIISGVPYYKDTDTNTDTKVTNTLAATTKAYVTGTTSASTSTGTQVFDTGVYLDTTAGRLHVTSLGVGSAVVNYDSTNKCVVITV